MYMDCLFRTIISAQQNMVLVIGLYKCSLSTGSEILPNKILSLKNSVSLVATVAYDSSEKAISDHNQYHYGCCYFSF